MSGCVLPQLLYSYTINLKYLLVRGRVGPFGEGKKCPLCQETNHDCLINQPVVWSLPGCVVPSHYDLNFVVSMGVLCRSVIGNSKEKKLSE